MIRTLIVAAIAFGVASSAWAKAGCYTSLQLLNPDTVCPSAENFTGYCVVSQIPLDPTAPFSCTNWYVCTSQAKPCPPSGTRPVQNSAARLGQMPGGRGGTNTIGADGMVISFGQKTSPTGANAALQPAPAVPAGLTPAQQLELATAQAQAATAQTNQRTAELNAANAARGALTRPPQPTGPLSKDPSVLRDYKTADDAYKEASRNVSSPNSAESAQKNQETAETYSNTLREAQARLDEADTNIKGADDQQAKDDRRLEKPGRTANEDDENCSLSGKLESKMACGGTRRMLKANEITNTVGQLAGAAATQFTGAQAQNQALSAGTQSAALRGAAATQSNAGKSQLLLGAVNAMMGMMEMKAGAKHNTYATTIKKDFEKSDLYRHKDQAGEGAGNAQAAMSDDKNWAIDGGALAKRAIDQNGIDQILQTREYHKRTIDNLNKAKKTLEGQLKTAQELPPETPGAAAEVKRYQDAITRKDEEIQTAVSQAGTAVTSAGRDVSGRAVGEQQKIAGEAKNAGIFAMLQGAQQMGQGALNVKAAGELNSAADQMADTENGGLVMAPPGQDAFPTTDTRAPTVITGNGAPPPGQDPASQDQTPTDDNANPLGGGLPGPTDNKPGEAPVPGKFTPGGGGGGVAGGGGIGGLSAGSTQAPGPDNTEKGPTAANPYVSGTTPVSGGGMVGPPPAGGKEAGLSPMDLMAQALGLNKPAEKDPNSQAYAGRRGPASQGGMGGGLGLPDEDIFKIVGDGYRRQIKAGNIGG